MKFFGKRRGREIQRQPPSWIGSETLMALMPSLILKGIVLKQIYITTGAISGIIKYAHLCFFAAHFHKSRNLCNMLRERLAV